jgi:hypothetical protein
MIQKVYHELDTCVLPSNSPPVLPGTAKCNPSKTKTAVMLAAKKRKTSTATTNFELIHAHDPGSFLQRLTLNTKCLQIAFFLMNFIFALTNLLETSKARIKSYFFIFSACYSSRKFVELCHGLLLLFNGPTPNKDTVIDLSVYVSGGESNIHLLDFMMGKVTFGKAQITVLYDKIHQDILSNSPQLPPRTILIARRTINSPL